VSRDRTIGQAVALALCSFLLVVPLRGQALPAQAAAASRPLLYAVHFVDAQHGWAAGQGIYATSDGGQHWQRQYAGSSEISVLDFTDRTHGWAVGNGADGTPPVLLRTVDGGQHWTKAAEPPPPPLASIQFLGATLGFGVTQLSNSGGGALVKTTDGGSLWQGIHTPLRVTSTCFANSKAGWAVAVYGDTILHTTDGGQHWTRSFSAGSDFQSGGQIACTGAMHAWALLYGGVGMNQQSYAVYRTTDGAHWQAVLASSTAGGGPAPGQPANAPQGIPGYGAVLDLLNSRTAFLLGGCPPCGGLGQSYLNSTTDGGHTWRDSGPIPRIAFGTHDLSFVTAKDGWLVSETFPPNGGQPYGVIVHTVDGGRTWSRQFPAR
jgi:photosystem II stability/assembly factor-like uncharacterized protein